MDLKLYEVIYKIYRISDGQNWLSNSSNERDIFMFINKCMMCILVYKS